MSTIIAWYMTTGTVNRYGVFDHIEISTQLNFVLIRTCSTLVTSPLPHNHSVLPEYLWTGRKDDPSVARSATMYPRRSSVGHALTTHAENVVAQNWLFENCPSVSRCMRFCRRCCKRKRYWVPRTSLRGMHGRYKRKNPSLNSVLVLSHASPSPSVLFTHSASYGT